MTKTKSIYLALLAVLLSPMVANADLIGSGVTATYHFDDLGDVLTTGATTVSGAVEWESGITEPWGNIAGVFESIDFTATAIDFVFQRGAGNRWNTQSTYNGWTFDFDVGVLSDLVGASFSANGFDYVDSMLSWVDDTLFVNWRGGGITGNPGVTIELEFAQVPEPGTLALLGIGLVGMGLSRRRRKV